MKSTPILFNGEMVRACLREVNPKTQTRRPIKPQPSAIRAGDTDFGEGYQDDKLLPFLKCRFGECLAYSNVHHCPFGYIGDRLWVKETWRDVKAGEIIDGEGTVRNGVAYQADGFVRWGGETLMSGGWKDTNVPFQFNPPKWRPSIHMPRRASRITLEITDVKVERVQEISEMDAMSEGFGWGCYTSDCSEKAKPEFQRTWDSIYGNWNENPWTWVIHFKKL